MYTHNPIIRLNLTHKSRERPKSRGCVEVWWWVEVLQVRAPPVSAPIYLSGCGLACFSHQRHICMCKKALCWSAVASPSPPASVCGRPVCNLFKCLWKLLVSSHRLNLTPDVLPWPAIPAFSRLLGYFQELSPQGGVRKWHTGHSCLSRFLPSMFVFLFPYSDSIWMELNLDSGGCFWRLFQVFQEYLSTNLQLREYI